jgi:hypothetical protein
LSLEFSELKENPRHFDLREPEEREKPIRGFKKDWSLEEERFLH